MRAKRNSAHHTKCTARRCNKWGIRRAAEEGGKLVIEKSNANACGLVRDVPRKIDSSIKIGIIWLIHTHWKTKETSGRPSSARKMSS
jgi:hypothetical protein